MDMSQEPFYVEIYRTNAGPQARKRQFVWKFTGKMPDPDPAEHVLRAPAQSKRTWTFHKSHFAWKLTGKMPDPPVNNTSSEPRAFYPYRKNPFSVGTLFGEQFDIMIHEVKALFSSPWKLLRSIYEQMR